MKKLIFVTGTRADFGKLKSLIKISQAHPDFEVHLFATGMHLDKKYGETIIEIEKSGITNIIRYENHEGPEYMDRTLANTIQGFSKVVETLKPDLIVVHGDRVEPLAGAIVGSLNNVLVAHIEGGEISGTVDELIRHAVSKLSHIHLVSNEDAKRRLIQMGEVADAVHVIGSPDFDLMRPSELPPLDRVKAHYDINFDSYAIVMYHPVTTELDRAEQHAEVMVEALLKADRNFVVIYPNNDLGCDAIFKAYQKLEGQSHIKIFPSLRFEYFLRLLKDAQFILGNSSAGIREAPYYNVPTIDVGTRQTNRAQFETITNVGFDSSAILETIANTDKVKQPHQPFTDFGTGQSDQQFLELLKSTIFWETDCQKQFKDL